MAGTRSSSRLSSQPKSSPTQPKESPKAAAGSKRKPEAGASPSAKRGRKSSPKKEQKTIEESMDVDQTDNTKDQTIGNGHTQESETKPRPTASESEKPEESNDPEPTEDTTPKAPAESTSNGAKAEEKANQKPATNGAKAENKSNDKAEDSPIQDNTKMDDTGKIEHKEDPQAHQKDEASADSNDAVESHARDDDTPSSVLEKGVIYFLFRGRTGIDNPSEVNDLARTYMILRPIPHGAKIGEGTIGDGHGKCRLLALPKKVLPLSGKDKFMTFVEKSKTTFKELKEEFMSASDYGTKTAGVRHTPAITPVAEGVYALTTTGRDSHLAYMITIPQELGEVQKDIGIRDQGSFITSAKNPEYAGPANTNLPQGPGFPKEILSEFRGLRWAPLQPKFLDYESCQFLLIGESGGIENTTEQQTSDQNGDANGAKEELEKLEGEDEIRVKHLKGDDAVFADLGISKKDYPQVPSTWND